jgi:organic radical activating enzyme
MIKKVKKLPKKAIPKKDILTEGKSFCIIPWIHLHTSPSGVAAPCCISESCATEDGVGNSRTQSLSTIINSDKMKQLRLDMLSDVRNPECAKCHNHEDQGVVSFRKHANRDYEQFFGEAMETTNIDGSLSEFKMRYFDIRFSNICNFKCRTCGSGFSTQWEQEDLKNNVWFARTIPKNDNKEFLSEVLGQIEHIETAYFAGGEPLITEEHYVILEEMIRSGRTDIQLSYNTNLSNLKFKDKDLLSLWSKFKKHIMIYASVDHYGDRAEYIRSGTDWGVVENNFLTAKKTPYIHLQMNTVLSVFNCLTIHEFYQYLIDKELYKPKDNVYSLYNMSTPEHLSCHILPSHLKDRGKVSLERAIQVMKDNKFTSGKITELEKSIGWIYAKDTWDIEKRKFQEELTRLDRIRGESFEKTFPELVELLPFNRKRLFPI